jgi:ketosteroid isomerase-like protein
MSDRDDIAELVHRYSDAVTRKDRAQWAATWADDAHWELGKGRVATGKADIVTMWQQAIDRYVVVVQMVHNGTVNLDGAGDGAGDGDGDTASGRWYISEHVSRNTGVLGIMVGWYDDTYVRIDGAWLFSSRSLAQLYHGPPDLTGDFTPRD